MPPNYAWLWVAVNVLALVAAVIGAGKWFRGWLVRQVSEPLAEIQRMASAANTEARRANSRLDRHVERHGENAVAERKRRRG